MRLRCEFCQAIDVRAGCEIWQREVGSWTKSALLCTFDRSWLNLTQNGRGAYARRRCRQATLRFDVAAVLAAEGGAADARSRTIAVPPLPTLEPDMDVPRRARPKIVHTNLGELIHRLRARFKASATGSGARAKQGRSRPRRHASVRDLPSAAVICRFFHRRWLVLIDELT